MPCSAAEPRGDDDEQEEASARHLTDLWASSLTVVSLVVGGTGEEVGGAGAAMVAQMGWPTTRERRPGARARRPAARGRPAAWGLRWPRRGDCGVAGFSLPPLMVSTITRHPGG